MVDSSYQSPFIGASGLDTNAIISALASVRQTPILRFQSQVAKLQKQTTEFGTLRTKLDARRTKASAIDTAAELRAYSASTTDQTVATASASSGATEGVYALTVTNLAQAASRISGGFTKSSGTAVGSGSISITSGTTTYHVSVSPNSDLTQIRDAINASGAPITATIIDDGSGTNQYKLILSGNTTGASSAFTVDTSGFTPAGSPLSFSTLNAAQDATFSVNGATIHRASNTVTDVIPGISLSLLKGNGATATVTVSKDRDTVKSRIKDLVSAFNDLNDEFRTNNNSAAKNTTAVLYGDATLRSTQSRIRSILDTNVTGTGSNYTSLASIGITTDSNGKLNVDDAKLTTALQNDYDGVIAIFTNQTNGIAVQARETAQSVEDHSIRSRTDGIQARIRSINNQITTLQDSLDSYISGLRDKFANLDAIAGRLQAQGGALSALGR
jgi:flagellar hook-associated protein 2